MECAGSIAGGFVLKRFRIGHTDAPEFPQAEAGEFPAVEQIINQRGADAPAGGQQGRSENLSSHRLGCKRGDARFQSKPGRVVIYQPLAQ